MAGHPKKYVDMDEVKHMLAFDCHLGEIAAILDVSRSTSVGCEPMLIGCGHLRRWYQETKVVQ